MISVPDLQRKRGVMCECCGKEHGTERHHCLIHRMAGHPELDDERNLELLCHNCHNGEANSYIHRVLFWRRQIERYPDMREWYDNLPLKVKENFE